MPNFIEKRMRILQIFGEPLSFGGQEAFTMNMYENIDKSKIQFDFFTPYYCDNDIKFVLTHSYYSSVLDNKCYCELNRESNYALMYDAVWLTPFRDDLMCDDVYSQYDDRIFVIGHVPIQNISANKYQLLSAISGSDDAYIDSFLKPYCWHNVIDIDGGLSYLSRAPIPCAAMFFRLNDRHVTKVFST